MRFEKEMDRVEDSGFTGMMTWRYAVHTKGFCDFFIFYLFIFFFCEFGIIIN
ncbi:hypothetical protein HanIR_Chr15g0732451 [Helianthus annuus]|nr:hypothetical protein HanIR_Chr15g0732451 [Helianthus annuus]